jgi:hypothetical protein
VPENPVPVTITGGYKFEVFDGQRSISASSQSHELNVAAGKTLRLVAPEYLLNQSVKVEGTPGQPVQMRAPDLGTLNVRSALETCTVVIGGRDLGYPPINGLKVASGQYQIDVVCPNGQKQSNFANVRPGLPATVKVP